MELSGLIFVALAVAWAAYLIPKALQHHDEVVRSRSVDRFSHRMRVLARREPLDGRNARLVVTPGRTPSAPVVTTKGSPSPATTRARRKAVTRATRRRRRVLGLILLANLAVVAVASFGAASWWWTAAPAGLLVVWLVACRLMVRSERGLRRRTAPPLTTRSAQPSADSRSIAGEPLLDDTMATIAAVPAAVADPQLWDPLPVTLPTYVSKSEAVRRTVRTIDLDSTGVWSSGRSESDSALAREADEAERTRRKSDRDRRRAVGS
ncbi:MAG: hypothetical protein ABIQ15_00785 [Nocardioides sp.]